MKHLLALISFLSLSWKCGSFVTQHRLPFGPEIHVSNSRRWGRPPVPVEQVDLTTGEVIREFKSLSAAAKAVNGTTGNISRVINGRLRSVKGFFWRKAGTSSLPRARLGGIPVEQVDLVTGEVIGVFPSIQEAVKAVNGSTTAVISGILRGRKDLASYKGFFWRRVGDLTTPRNRTQPPIPQGRQKIEQICHETGKVLNTFDSLTEASISLRIHRSHIRRVLLGLQKQTRGFSFRKVGDLVPYKKSTKRRPVRQICLDTGNVIATFPSLTSAGRAVNRTAQVIGSAATGITSKSSGGYGWKLVEEE